MMDEGHDWCEEHKCYHHHKQLYPTTETARFIKRIGDDAIWDVTLPVNEIHTVRIPASRGAKTAIEVAKVQRAGQK